MRVRSTSLDGPLLIEPVIHGDARGFFVETFRHDDIAGLGLGDGVDFVQDNHSRSRRGVVRGMHFQLGDGIAKLVRCARGAIVDVVVDLRRGSPHFGRWEAFALDDETHAQLLVPVGFAHGFCVMSDVADVIYRQTGYYDPALDRGVAYDDPEIGIDWPVAPVERLVSDRDASAPALSAIADELPFRYGGVAPQPR
ncbi:MAG: dTDP-4-dehydrorhamnose 3,5-epimerase [Solirubrobacteraceae bacterium]